MITKSLEQQGKIYDRMEFINPEGSFSLIIPQITVDPIKEVAHFKHELKQKYDFWRHLLFEMHPSGIQIIDKDHAVILISLSDGNYKKVDFINGIPMSDCLIMDDSGIRYELRELEGTAIVLK